jgi:hypothetical protein
VKSFCVVFEAWFEDTRIKAEQQCNVLKFGQECCFKLHQTCQAPKSAKSKKEK